MKKIVLVFGALILLFSCTTELEEGGTLILSLSNSGFQIQTILPPVDMNVASYTAAGSGPFGDSFEVTSFLADDLVQVPSLEPGEWTIVVYANNAEGSIIGSGNDDTVLIVSGQVTTVSITVVPIEGIGTLSVQVEWPAGVLGNPSVTGTLAAVGSDPPASPIQFSMASDALSASNMQYLDTGYYTLTIRLSDGSDPLWGVVEGVRIVSGQVSGKVYELVSAVNQGGLALTIDPALDNPITITFQGQLAELGQHSATPMTVTATTGEPVDSYQWYLQGEPLAGENDAVVDIATDLKLGTYWLSLVVTKDAVVSSGHVEFDVVSTGAGISVYPSSGLQTSENGTTATFEVELDIAPTADVMIALESTDIFEGTVSPALLTFTPTDWATAQTVTLTGANDDITDGNQS